MRNLVLPFVLVSAVGCAQKKYVGGDGGAGGQGKATAVCDATNRLPVSGNCVTFSWEKPQEGRKPGIGIVKIWRPNRADGSPVPVDAADTIEVVLWMPHMGGGHGSDPVTVEKADSGTFRAKRVFFSMRGLWEIRIFVKSAGNTVEEIYLPFTY